MAQLPRLSYVLLSHNREKYIRKALESAFAQDYEGELEYIISDDCSTDRTYEIIQECVASYKGGRRVVVTQTPRNLHLAGNTNHAVQFVTSDWVIRADDDDLSCVDRCTQIGRAILANPGCSCVMTLKKNFSDGEEEEALMQARIHCEEKTPAYKTYDIRKGEDGYMPFFSEDCCHQVWATRVYREFGSLPLEGCFVDDVICMYRANAIGYVVYAPILAVMVRNGSGNMCRGNDYGERGYRAIVNLEKFHDRYYNMSQKPLQDTLQQIASYLERNSTPKEWESSQTFLQCITADLAHREKLKMYWRVSIMQRYRIARLGGSVSLFLLLRCLPLPIFAAILTLLRKLKIASGR